MRRVIVDSTPDTASNETAKPRTRRKPLPYTPESKISPEFTDSQKRFSETFNAMRQRLLDLGEMQQK